MITIRKIFLFVVLILFFACSEEKEMIEKGNLIVSKIENYRNKFGKVPDSLSVIGIKVIDESNPPFYYQKEGKNAYSISFSNGVGESKIFYSDTQQWEDLPREIRTDFR